MLIRISLILAIVAALAVAVLNFTMVKNKVTELQTNLKTETEQHHTFENKYNTTRKDLEKTTAQLTQTNNMLVATISQRDQAVQEADAAKKQASDLTDKLAKTSKSLSDANDELAAYKASGLSPGQVASLAKDLKVAQDNVAGARDENKLLSGKIKKLENELAFYKNPNAPRPLPATCQGKILVSDPKWDFVILDIGSDKGALDHGQLLVSRNGKLVAKVVITSVQKDRCVANVLPEWKLGEPMEGDQVIPAYPSES